MNVSGIASDLLREYKHRKYFVDLEILEQTRNLIKARLSISADLFVQVYRTDPYQTKPGFNSQRDQVICA